MGEEGAWWLLAAAADAGRIPIVELVDGVKVLICDGLDLAGARTADPHREPPLVWLVQRPHLACAALPPPPWSPMTGVGCETVCDWLVAMGCHPSDTDSSGRTAMMHAVGAVRFSSADPAHVAQLHVYALRWLETTGDLFYADRFGTSAFSLHSQWMQGPERHRVPLRDLLERNELGSAVARHCQAVFAVNLTEAADGSAGQWTLHVLGGTALQLIVGYYTPLAVLEVAKKPNRRQRRARAPHAPPHPPLHTISPAKSLTSKSPIGNAKSDRRTVGATVSSPGSNPSPTPTVPSRDDGVSPTATVPSRDDGVSPTATVPSRDDGVSPTATLIGGIVSPMIGGRTSSMAAAMEAHEAEMARLQGILEQSRTNRATLERAHAAAQTVTRLQLRLAHGERLSDEPDDFYATADGIARRALWLLQGDRPGPDDASAERKIAEWRTRHAVADLHALSLIAPDTGPDGDAVATMFMTDMVAAGVVPPLLHIVATRRQLFSIAWPADPLLTHAVWLLANIAGLVGSRMSRYLIQAGAVGALLPHLVRFIAAMSHPSPDVARSLVSLLQKAADTSTDTPSPKPALPIHPSVPASDHNSSLDAILSDDPALTTRPVPHSLCANPHSALGGDAGGPLDDGTAKMIPKVSIDELPHQLDAGMKVGPHQLDEAMKVRTNGSWESAIWWAIQVVRTLGNVFDDSALTDEHRVDDGTGLCMRETFLAILTQIARSFLRHGSRAVPASADDGLRLQWRLTVGLGEPVAELLRACTSATVCVLRSMHGGASMPTLELIADTWSGLIQLPHLAMRSDVAYIFDRVCQCVHERPDADDAARGRFFRTLLPPNHCFIGRFVDVLRQASPVCEWNQDQTERRLLHRGLVTSGLRALVTLTSDANDAADVFFNVPGAFGWIVSLVPAYSRPLSAGPDNVPDVVVLSALRIVANACGGSCIHIRTLHDLHAEGNVQSVLKHGQVVARHGILFRLFRLVASGDRSSRLRETAAWGLGSLLVQSSPAQLLAFMEMRPFPHFLTMLRDEQMREHCRQRLLEALLEMQVRVADDVGLVSLWPQMRDFNLPGLVAELAANKSRAPSFAASLKTLKETAEKHYNTFFVAPSIFDLV